MVELIYIPTSSVGGFPFLHSQIPHPAFLMHHVLPLGDTQHGQSNHIILPLPGYRHEWQLHKGTKLAYFFTSMYLQLLTKGLIHYP